MAEYIDKEAVGQAVLELPSKVDEDGFIWVLRRDAFRAVDDWPVADVRENVIRTQADKLRAMSDEELADKLWSIAHYEQKKRCISDWLDWLKSPVEVDHGGTD